jgi:predicted RNA-binding Zn-ribbon protein involved in translation (DUF1610 family)
VTAFVDPRGTNQTCSGCGAQVVKNLLVVIHVCPMCGLVLDRDVNAARNILKRGLEIGWEPPKYTPDGEWPTMCLNVDAQAAAVGLEAYIFGDGWFTDLERLKLRKIGISTCDLFFQ